jgi:serine protease Do
LQTPIYAPLSLYAAQLLRRAGVVVGFLLLLQAPLVSAKTAADTFKGASESVFTVEIQTASDRSRNSQGSAFVVLRPNLLMTNYHVVSDYVLDPEEYVVVVKDAAGEMRRAQVRAVDVVSDLALLSTQEPIGKPLRIRESMPSKGVKGFSLGNPGGIGLTVVEGNFNGLSESAFVPVIHFSGAINSGMSGGPAVDEAGEVVGVNTATRRGDQLIGLLSPAENVTRLLAAFSDDEVASADALRGQIETQVAGFSNRLAQEVLGHKTDKVVSGHFELPSKFQKKARCYGETEKDATHRFKVTTNYCSLRGGIFVNDATRVGTLTVHHRRVFGEALTPSQVAAVQNKLSESDVKNSGASIEDKTVWICEHTRVELQAGTVGELHACQRGLTRLKDVRDFYFLFASRPSRGEGLMTELRFNGITNADANKLVKHFLLQVTEVASRSPS